MNVASFTDAWIETADNTEEYQPPFVASFTDAWIETPVVSNINLGNWMSHLLQMRDWNHSSKARLNVSLMSHPLRGQLL